MRGLEEIGKKWGELHLAYYPDWKEERGRWILSNQTDEGLGPEPRKSFRGRSVEEVVEMAKKDWEENGYQAKR